MAAHAWDVNIFIWTSCKSVDHKENGRVMVHGEDRRADGRRFKFVPPLRHRRGPQDQRGAGAFCNRKSNVGYAQANQLALPTTKAPETQIHFINHWSGAFLVLRQRTVVRGERASQSIVNRTTASWPIWVVASLILAGPGSEPLCVQTRGAKLPNRAALTGHLTYLDSSPSGLNVIYHY